MVCQWSLESLGAQPTRMLLTYPRFDHPPHTPLHSPLPECPHLTLAPQAAAPLLQPVPLTRSTADNGMGAVGATELGKALQTNGKVASLNLACELPAPLDLGMCICFRRLL